jgi:hypothetical protein
MNASSNASVEIIRSTRAADPDAEFVFSFLRPVTLPQGGDDKGDEFADCFTVVRPCVAPFLSLFCFSLSLLFVAFKLSIPHNDQKRSLQSRARLRAV